MKNFPKSKLLAENGGLPTGNYPRDLLREYHREDLVVLKPTTLEEGLRDFGLFGEFVAGMRTSGIGEFVFRWRNGQAAQCFEFVEFVKNKLG